MRRAGFRHAEVPGQLLFGSPQHLKEILFKVKEILLSVHFSLFPNAVVIYYFMIIHIEYVKPASTRRLTPHDCGGQFLDVPGQVPTLSSPKSGFDYESCFFCLSPPFSSLHFLFFLLSLHMHI